MFKAALLLAIIIIVSGCTTGIQGLSLLPSTTLESPRDVLVIKEANTIPTSPISPGQNTDLSFVLENTDDSKEAKRVTVQLFDAPGFMNSNSKLCNVDNSCQPSECIADSECTILPGEQKFLSIEMMSPTENQIANVENKLTLGLKASYYFDSSTIYRIPIVNFDEIKSRQRAGQTTEIAIPKIISSGPLEADIEIQGQQYILKDRESTFVVTISDKGNKREGNVKDNKIVSGRIKVVFPHEGMKIIDWPKKGSPLAERNGFNCDESSGICQNSADVELFKGESVPLLFKVKAIGDVDPFKSFDVKIDITNYIYELRKSVEVTVRPFENQ